MDVKQIIKSIKENAKENEQEKINEKNVPVYIVTEDIQEKVWVEIIDTVSDQNILIGKILSDTKAFNELQKDSIISIKYDEKDHKLYAVGKLSLRTFNEPTRGILKEIESDYESHVKEFDKYSKKVEELFKDILDDLDNLLKAYNLNNDDITNLKHNLRSPECYKLMINYLCNNYDISNPDEIIRESAVIGGLPFYFDESLEDIITDKKITIYAPNHTENIELNMKNIYSIAGKKVRITFNDATEKIGFVGSTFTTKDINNTIAIYEDYSYKQGFTNYNIYNIDDIKSIEVLIEIIPFDKLDINFNI